MSATKRSIEETSKSNDEEKTPEEHHGEKDRNEDTNSSRKRPKLLQLDIPDDHDPTNPAHFDHFLFHLLSYRAQKQSYAVSKEESPQLFRFTQFLQSQYAASNNNGTSQLSPQQFQVLDFLHIPLTSSRGDEHWNRQFRLLQDYQRQHGHVLVPRTHTVLGEWTTEQRRQYKAASNNTNSTLTPDRIQRLEGVGFVWQVRSRPEWDDRFQQLEAYKDEFGHCKVPQHYAANKGLGKWVAKQREQYKLLQKGRHSFLNDYRIEKLTSIGFVWSIRCAGSSLDLTLPANEAETQEDNDSKQQEGDDAVPP